MMTSIAAHTVPHLTTALTGPLHKVESYMLDNQSVIESWFRSQWRLTRAPFYASVDIRNAGFKIAPVDTNLFPAGFNNLNPAFESLCIQAVQVAVEHLHADADRILIIPENHTRNPFYLENLATLQQIIEKAGFETRLGSLIPDLDEPLSIDLDSGRSVYLEPLLREGDIAKLADFIPDLIILNNDLSSGRPAILENLAQPVTPGLVLGWSSRLKSIHFTQYQRVAQEFAQLIDMDPWLIDPMFRNCGEVDFLKREGITCLSTNIEALLTAIQNKYDEYEVNSKPFVMVKADAGTYGMSVMTVHSADEVSELNRKQRTRMATTKEGQKVSKVIIQEGVYTHETWGDDDTVAEPVIYMIDHNVIGGFYRVHAKRATNENLNAPGMRFERLAFEDCCISPEKNLPPAAHPNRFYVYGVIARLALLAAAREMVSTS
jgi:glutamate--cysteine ligase